MDRFNLSGKVAVVVGGTSGIGEQLAQGLAEAGAAPHHVLVNAIAPSIFPTALNAAILDSPRGRELTLRTPMARFGHRSELVTTALLLASDQTSFTTGQIMMVDGGFLASGVNQ